MTDEEIYRDRLTKIESEKERHKTRLDLYKETYERECFNAREHEEKRQTFQEANDNNKSARNVRKAVVADLELTGEGREFLQKEAHEIRADVYARDKEIREEKEKFTQQAQENAAEKERIEAADKAAQKLPRAAEITVEEVQSSQDDGKRKAAEIVAYLAAQEEKRQQQPPIESNNEIEREREKRRQRDKGMEME